MYLEEVGVHSIFLNIMPVAIKVHVIFIKEVCNVKMDLW